MTLGPMNRLLLMSLRRRLLRLDPRLHPKKNLVRRLLLHRAGLIQLHRGRDSVQSTVTAPMRIALIVADLSKLWTDTLF